MNYQKLAETMTDDFGEYMLSKHYQKIYDTYSDIVEEYIAEKLGILNEKAHEKLKKQLLKLYIS